MQWIANVLKLCNDYDNNYEDMVWAGPMTISLAWVFHEVNWLERRDRIVTSFYTKKLIRTKYLKKISGYVTILIPFFSIEAFIHMS